jgi:hypothetical protein
MGGTFSKATPNILLTPDEFPELFNNTFIVERTNGDKEDGWTLPNPETGHKCWDSQDIFKSWALKDTNGKWRVYMVGLSGQAHSCGWRRVETFRPSDGWNDGAEAALIAKLENKLTKIPQSEIDEFESKSGIKFNSRIDDNVPVKVNQNPI